MLTNVLIVASHLLDNTWCKIRINFSYFCFILQGIQTPCGHLPVVSPLTKAEDTTESTATTSSAVPTVSRGYIGSNTTESSFVMDNNCQGKQPPALDQFRKMNIRGDVQHQANTEEDSVKVSQTVRPP